MDTQQLKVVIIIYNHILNAFKHYLVINKFSVRLCRYLIVLFLIAGVEYLTKKTTMNKSPVNNIHC